MLSRILRRFGHERGPWRPRNYRVTETRSGADVNYDCYCGCDAGFALDRSAGAGAAPEHCCCGNAIIVGEDAEARLAGFLDEADAFRIDVQDVQMPWGESARVALAIPTEADRS